ncbi:hypothetical protein BJ742DRAFT_866062 [Cladochytrium replicatum]|nr:hypothetical protein BJ742DRAFT_866062 [Cladochytrium replicatum]
MHSRTWIAIHFPRNGNRYQRTFVDDIFGGKLVSVIVCDACKNITYHLEDFMDLSLPIISEENKSGFFGMKRVSTSASMVDKFVDGMASLTVGKEPIKTPSKAPPSSCRNDVDSPFSENSDHLNLISVLLRQVGPPGPAPMENTGKKPLLVNNKKSLMICMRNMMAADVLDGDNSFACEYCFKLSLIPKISANAPSSGTDDAVTAADDAPRIIVNGGTESVRGSETDGLEDEDRFSTRTALSDLEKSIDVPLSPTNTTSRLMSTMSNALMSRSRSLANSLSSTSTSASSISRQSSPARDLPAAAPVAPRLGDISIKRRAYKRCLIHSTPEILVLTLKRFILVGSSGRTKKIEESVAFDEYVDLSPMMAPDEVIALSEQMHGRLLRKELEAKIRVATAAGGSEVKPVALKDDDDSDPISPSSPLAKATASEGNKPSLRYRVYAAVVHSGGLFGGHYTAFVRSRRRPADISVKPFEARSMNAAQKSPTVDSAPNASAEAAPQQSENGGEDKSTSVAPSNGVCSSSSRAKVPEEADSDDNDGSLSAVGLPINEDGASTLAEDGAAVNVSAAAEGGEEADDWIYYSDTMLGSQLLNHRPIQGKIRAQLHKPKRILQTNHLFMIDSPLSHTIQRLRRIEETVANQEESLSALRQEIQEILVDLGDALVSVQRPVIHQSRKPSGELGLKLGLGAVASGIRGSFREVFSSRDNVGPADNVPSATTMSTGEMDVHMGLGGLLGRTGSNVSAWALARPKAEQHKKSRMELSFGPEPVEQVVEPMRLVLPVPSKSSRVHPEPPTMIVTIDSEDSQPDIDVNSADAGETVPIATADSEEKINVNRPKQISRSDFFRRISISVKRVFVSDQAEAVPELESVVNASSESVATAKNHGSAEHLNDGSNVKRNKRSEATGHFAIHPNSLFRHIWNTVQNISHVLFFLVLPVTVGFKELMDLLPVFSVISGTIFGLSVVITSLTGYQKENMVIMDPKRILRRYVRGWFFFDLLTSIPWVFIVDAIVGPDKDARFTYRVVCFLVGLRFIKLVTQKRPTWFERIFRQMHRSLGMSFSFLETVKVLFVMALYWHWNGCFMNWLSSVIHLEEHGEPGELFAKYAFRLYNTAAEMLAAGFGAETPVNTVTRLVTILNMIVCSVFVAVLVGNVSAFMIGLDSSGRLFKEKLDEVNQYMAYKGLDSATRQRVIEYYEFKYAKRKYFDEDKILKELNAPIRKRISLHNCRSLILRVPFFSKADNGFIGSIVRVLQLNHFLAGDVVLEEGTSGEEMYFILSGVLEVVIGGRVQAQLMPGMFFGEIAVLFGRMKRTANIRAVTPCVLYSLSKRDLDVVLEDFPEVTEAMTVVANERLARVTAIKSQESI